MKRNPCTECVYFSFDYYSYGGRANQRCTHPKFFAPVDNGGVPIEYARLESKKCGPTGKLFKPRPTPEPMPTWQRYLVAAFIGIITVGFFSYLWRQ